MFSISLHVILLAMVLVVAIDAAAVSFAPLYVVALNNAEDSAKSYKLSITREIALRVEVLFDNVQSVVSTMTAAAQMGSWAEGDVASITQWMRYGVTRSEASGVNMVFDNGVVWTAGYVRPDSSAVAAGTFALVKYNTTHGIERIVGTQNLSTLSTSIFSTTTDLRTREFFPLIRSQQGWGDAFVDTSLGVAEAVVLPCGAPIVLPDDSTVGALYVGMGANTVVDYFKTLHVKSTGRAMLVDASTGAFVASNSAADPPTKVVGGAMVVTQYTDVQDPLIQSVVASLGRTLLTCSPMPCVLEVGSGDDLVFVTVADVSDASFARDKRVVVMIPSSDFLGEMRTSTKISLGAAAGAVFGLMALSALAVAAILRPLARLEAKLHASVALVDADADDDAPSVIEEIRNIEVAYAILQAQLKRVKSFLPQSVLKQLEEADEQQAVDEEASEGSIQLGDSRNTDSLNVSGSDLSASASRSRSRHLSMTSADRRRAVENSRILSTTVASTVPGQRTCTVVMGNVEGLHRFLKAPEELVSFHTAVMTIVANEVNAVKGVFDAFHGDRFTLTFNSSTNCASHCSSAAAFMLAVRSALALAANKQHMLDGAGPVTPPPAHVFFGAATGKALCGNLGTEQIKRFCTVGAVVNHASALMAACRGLHVDNLISLEAHKGMALEYVCDNISMVTLPHSHQPSMVGTVRERRAAKMDEWMYELEQGEAATDDPRLLTIATLNKALDALKDGNHAVAKELLTTVPIDVPSSLVARVAHVRRLAEAQESGQPILMTTT